MARAVRRINRLYDLYLDYNDQSKSIRRFQKTNKRKKYSTLSVYKYGIQLPQNVAHSKAPDYHNGKEFWKNSMEKEVNALLYFDLLEFKPYGHRGTFDDSWQEIFFHIVLGVKHSLQ